MAREKGPSSLIVIETLPPDIRRVDDKVKTLLRKERHAHKMVVRWRSKVIRSGVPAEFARRYPMSTNGHLGRMLQKWILRERNVTTQRRKWQRRFWREVNGDCRPSHPRRAENLVYAPATAELPEQCYCANLSGEESKRAGYKGADPSSSADLNHRADTLGKSDVPSRPCWKFWIHDPTN